MMETKRLSDELVVLEGRLYSLRRLRRNRRGTESRPCALRCGTELGPGVLAYGLVNTSAMNRADRICEPCVEREISGQVTR